MINTLLIITAFVLGGITSFLIVFLRMTRDLGSKSILIKVLESEKESLSKRVHLLSELEEKYRDLIKERAILETRLEKETQHNNEKIELLKNAETELKKNFQNLANEIFEKKASQFNENSSSSLEKLLKPFREQIHTFQKTVKDNHETDIKERQTIKDSLSTLNQMNIRLSEEATNLTKALKGNTKTQGNWGEMILETLLEKSGLVKGVEYDVQVNSKSEDGKRYLPDVVVHMPGSRDVIIDSKVSLKAYESYINNQSTDREVYLKDHITSIKNHIRELSSKEYQKLNNLDTLDFVFMFIPVEGALITALQEDNDLFNDAFNKNIVIVGPTTLLATLRTIENVWKNDKQNKNALEIARKAGDLYDKFVNFVTDMEKIGKNLSTTQKTYDDALKKLSTGKGCLTNRAEAIKELGIKSSKSLTIN